MSFQDGEHGAAGLIQATDGNFYGATPGGGADALGTVFKVTPGGVLTRLYSFCVAGRCPNGHSPKAGLVQGPDGNFYGTTPTGGSHDAGTVFKMTPRGTLTRLYNFCVQAGCTDGTQPLGALLRGSDGNFYGAATTGGANNHGTDFRITPGGTLIDIHFFEGTDGSNPEAGLIPVPDGNFYGTTLAGGTYGRGTVYEITPTGALTTLYNFCAKTGCPDGAGPFARLVRGTDGNFYGTTIGGGPSNAGTVFKITPKGVLTTLHSFGVSPTGPSQPSGGLVQATDGSFYGMTQADGTNNAGTIFKITPKGALTTLYNFCAQSGCADGSFPMGELVQSTDGNFYGSTGKGGTDACPSGCGTIFKLSVGLDPFVTSQTYSGKVGAKVIILGNNLTGVTRVSFNGTRAPFTVVSASEITATVPTGATTGRIQVTTPSGALNSNTAFYVTPQVLSFTPSSASVGTSVQITGVSLTQVTAVTFGGVKATSFTVNSDTQVTATVPAGAKTGRVALSTPGGAAWSATDFTVQ